VKVIRVAVSSGSIEDNLKVMMQEGGRNVNEKEK
jgi:hypothetical protein